MESYSVALGSCSVVALRFAATLLHSLKGWDCTHELSHLAHSCFSKGRWFV